MGLFDKLQAAAEGMAAQQAQASAEALDASLPLGAPRPRTDRVRITARHRSATIAAYIGIVGLQPEDVYGIVPQQNNDITVAYDIVYRDRPEYEAGRQAWAARAAG